MKQFKYKWMPKNILFLCVATIVIIVSCKPVEEKLCFTCKYPSVLETYMDDTIEIANVITANNFAFCDSFVKIEGENMPDAFVEPYVKYNYMKQPVSLAEKQRYIKEGNDSVCPCTLNDDSQYNDMNNSILYIKGIQNYPNNTLTISKDGSDLPLRIYQNYNNQSKVFNGYYIDSTGQGKHLVGDFTYTLILYKTNSKTEVLKQIQGGFTIIRTPQDCPTTNCVGKDANDPLLSK